MPEVSGADASEPLPQGGFRLPFADLPRTELEKLLDAFSIATTDFTESTTLKYATAETSTLLRRTR